MPLSFTCDSDESVAKGACLQCALLSPSFKMKNFEVVDITPYAVQLYWEKAPGGLSPSLSDMECALLYKRFSRFPSVKEISFKNYQKPFQLVVEYAEAARHARQLNYATVQQPIIGRFQCDGMEDHLVENPTRLKVRVKLDMHGIVTVSSAQLLKREVVEDTPKSSGAVHSAPSEDAKCQKCDKTKAEAEVKEMLVCSDCGAIWCCRSCRSADDKAHAKECKPSAVEDGKPRTRVRRVHLRINTLKVGGLTQEDFRELQYKENQMVGQDAMIEECIEARNKLES